MNSCAQKKKIGHPTQSIGFPQQIPVYENAGFASDRAFAWSQAVRRMEWMLANSGRPRIFGPQPKSSIMKRFTPAASAASIMTAWIETAPAPTTQTAAPCPASAFVRASTVYSLLMTGIPGGNVEVDSMRVMKVTAKSAVPRAAVIGVPKLPEAWEEVSHEWFVINGIYQPRRRRLFG